MEGFILLKQGAEARIYAGIYLGKPTILKERFIKNYRHKYLNDILSKDQIKSECRAIVRCKTFGIKTPTIYFVDFEKRMIFMEHFIHSISLKDYIEIIGSDQLMYISLLIGQTLGKMHEGDIIHGDLTTSNMLLVNKNNEDNFDNTDDLQLVLIDFGLAHVNPSAEDKGVDLYVLERALLSTHLSANLMFPKILEGYSQESRSNFKNIIAKYEEVRARGRKRTMVG